MLILTQECLRRNQDWKPIAMVEAVCTLSSKFEVLTLIMTHWYVRSTVYEYVRSLKHWIRK